MTEKLRSGVRINSLLFALRLPALSYTPVIQPRNDPQLRPRGSATTRAPPQLPDYKWRHQVLHARACGVGARAERRRRLTSAQKVKFLFFFSLF